jgi:CRISPR-associated protein Csb3
MSQICLRLDPLNPGQVLACCGLLELCEGLA